MAYCHKCGKELDPQAQYCWNCGTTVIKHADNGNQKGYDPLTSMFESPEFQNAMDQNAKVMLKILIGLGIGAVGIIVISVVALLLIQNYIN